MAFYPHPHQFPIYMNAYPMPFPNQEFYPVYPPHPHPGSGHHGHGHSHGHGHGHGPGQAGLDGTVYFEAVPPQSGVPSSGGGSRHFSAGGKYGYNNRKDSSDSGISDYSVNTNSRKTSMASTVSGASAATEATDSSLEDVKEEMPPYEEPDDDLCEKIVQQVEFYFSDANITKDKFLLKHVKRNKEGFVSLKLISSFKRVKHLTKDWRQVAAAIERKSDKLEVNDLKTKVRRLDELPEYDETTPSRTVVALNLPLERPTIEGVAELFAVCGEIVLIRILRPGNPIPADIKPFVNKHPEMVTMVCALVEFERTEFALKAVRELNDEEDPEKMKVMELTAPPAKTVKKDEKKKSVTKQLPPTVPPHQQHQQQPPALRRFSHAGFGFPGPQHPGQPGDQMGQLGPRRKISLYHNMKFSPIAEEHKKEAAVAVAAALGGLNPNAPTFQMQPPLPRRSIPRSAAYMNPAAAMEAAAAHAAAAHAAQQAAASMQMQMQMHAHAAQTQWMSPRRFTGGGMDMATSGLAIPPNVMRLPKGPDKGKGFQKWCRNRMEASQAPVKKSHAVPIVAPPEETEAAEENPKVEITQVAAADEEKEDTENREEDAAVASASVPAPAPAEEREVVDASDDGAGDSGNDSEPDADSGAAAAAAAPVVPAASADRVGLAAAVESVAERAAEKTR